MTSVNQTVDPPFLSTEQALAYLRDYLTETGEALGAPDSIESALALVQKYPAILEALKQFLCNAFAIDMLSPNCTRVRIEVQPASSLSARQPCAASVENSQQYPGMTGARWECFYAGSKAHLLSYPPVRHPSKIAGLISGAGEEFAYVIGCELTTWDYSSVDKDGEDSEDNQGETYELVSVELIADAEDEVELAYIGDGEEGTMYELVFTVFDSGN